MKCIVELNNTSKNDNKFGYVSPESLRNFCSEDKKSFLEKISFRTPMLYDEMFKANISEVKINNNLEEKIAG